MRGHEPIIAMRQRGVKPAVVYLDTTRNDAPMKSWQDWPDVSPSMPAVWVQPDDAPKRLDMRFLFGLTAVISGIDHERVRALAQAAYEAGALRVITAEIDGHPGAVRVTDTLGMLDADTPVAKRAAQLLGIRAELHMGVERGSAAS